MDHCRRASGRAGGSRFITSALNSVIHILLPFLTALSRAVFDFRLLSLERPLGYRSLPSSSSSFQAPFCCFAALLVVVVVVSPSLFSRHCPLPSILLVFSWMAIRTHTATVLLILMLAGCPPFHWAPSPVNQCASHSLRGSDTSVDSTLTPRLDSTRLDSTRCDQRSAPIVIFPPQDLGAF